MFTVTVKGAAAQLSDLHAALQGVGAPGASLSDKVTTAQTTSPPMASPVCAAP